MTVTSLSSNLFQDCQALYEFLLAFKQATIAKNQTKFLSISQEISPVDPLAILQAIAKPNQLHFYLENPRKKEAIAAIDSIACLKIETGDRFYQSQQFIESCLANTNIIIDRHFPFAGPHFFCSFTFFKNTLTQDNPFPSATIFLPRWQVSFKENRSVLVANIAIDAKLNIQELSKNLWQTYNLIQTNTAVTRNIAFLLDIGIERKNKFSKQDVTNNTNLQNSVLSALSSIQANKISKVVLANAVDVISPVPFHLIPSLHHLRLSHPDCYIFSTSNSKGQNFIGASPERLISINDHHLVTDALAGSAPRGRTSIEDILFGDRLLNSEKERHEHRVVIDFITQCLSQLGLTPLMLPEPQLLKLSNIQHLWTPIKAKVTAGVHPLEILAELHPTPAVAGVPRDIACQQIRQYETFARSLYAAPLGWVDYRGNSEFIVGIRSALIDGCHARLYAGAGIVAGSDPQKELAEIQLKLQALLKVLV